MTEPTTTPTDPVAEWLRADSGTAKAAAGNKLLAEIKRLRAENEAMREDIANLIQAATDEANAD